MRQSVFDGHWYRLENIDELDRRTSSEIAVLTARVQELEVAGADLLAAFVRHRTATHVTKPHYCETCRESDAAMARARAALAAPPTAEREGK